jgi:hypothetical protein
MNHLNEIGDRGTKQISKMLENNKVRQVLYACILYVSELFITDNHRLES